MAGHRVLVVEREKFPRYHIGESLITGCIPVIEKLDLWERLEQLGFTKKYGATLLWGATKGVWDFRFADGSTYEHAYQVRRADFDALLLARARELGAHVIEEATVKDAEFDGDRVVGISYAPKGADTPVRVRSRILLDASGQGRMLGRRLDLMDWHEDLRNIAVWSYFQGCSRLDGQKAGDALVENRPGGWFWFIPLNDGTVSIGYVTHIKDLQASGKSPEDLFAIEQAELEEIKRLMQGATRVSAFRTTRDWSYRCRRFQGPGWALVGDAAAFVDPLFSTGVTLAMWAGRAVAEAADEALRDPTAEEDAMARYERGYQEFFGQVLEFVRFFYNTSMRKEQYWEGAQAIVDPDKFQEPKIDFAQLVSGLFGGQPNLESLDEARAAFREALTR
jgi:flavin-dependent dehydrogenase